VTRALAAFASDLRFDEIPTDVRTLAKQCLLDWLGVTLAGSRQEAARILRAEVLEQGGAPQATILGAAVRTGVGQAALVNGTASHVLDYDDVLFERRLHASVGLFPALLALAERDARSGRDLIVAFVAGVETACRIGRLVTDAHRERGHHPTATLGTLGAAAGAARLLRLDVEASAAALGIAATQAAGLRAMFGTMSKALHAGKASANGLLSALLAGRGFGSRADAIECLHGFADTLSPACEPGAALAGLGETYALRDVLFKYHAACYSAHAAIDAAARLRALYRLDPRAIANVTVRATAASLAICDIRSPQTGLEAKFSLRLTTAMALSGRNTAEIGSYSDAACVDPELVALRDATRVVGARELAAGASEVIVRLRDGAVHRLASDVSEPNRDFEAQGRRLEGKFAALASPVIGSANARELIARVGELEHLERLDDLVRCCAATG